MGVAASIMALTGALGSSGGSAGYLDVTTTNSTTSKSETHTADGTFSTVGDVIIHDGWNQQYTSFTWDAYTQANDGTLTVSGANVTVDVEVWGAAGGSGNASHQGRGGGGEYRKARMVLKPGTYYWMVGGGGCSGGDNSYAPGGWGGGGSAGGGIKLGGQTGNSGDPFADGGAQGNNGLGSQAFGAGGGGLTGLFGASTPSQSDALLVAGAGGGYGYSSQSGRGGGEDATTRCASTTAAGVGAGSAANGGAGYAGYGYTRGGGGGGGYWGGGGGDSSFAGQSGGGGGMGFTVATDGHSLVGAVSETVTAEGNTNGNMSSEGSISPNYKTDVGESTGSSNISGRGGRIAITIVDLGG